MAEYGLKISQEGFDVKNATDQQLVFSTDFNTYKIAKVVTLSTPLTGLGGDVVTVSTAHNLGYPPAFTGVGYGNVSTGIRVIPNNGFDTVFIDAWVDSTNVYAYYTDTGSLGDTLWTWKITLFALNLTKV